MSLIFYILNWSSNILFYTLFVKRKRRFQIAIDMETIIIGHIFIQTKKKKIVGCGELGREQNFVLNNKYDQLLLIAIWEWNVTFQVIYMINIVFLSYILLITYKRILYVNKLTWKYNVFMSMTWKYQ